MNLLVTKIAALLPELEKRGEVYLFALAEREDINRWTVILSSAWSDVDYTAAVRIVAEALMARLEPRELVTLSSVMVIPSGEKDILEMPESMEDILPGNQRLIEISLAGLDVKRAFIFKSKRPNDASTAASLHEVATVDA